MKILFGGVNHFDPGCRGRLEGWLTSIRLPMETEPDFVGLEWDFNHFEEVRQSRPAFRHDLSQEFPQLSGSPIRDYGIVSGLRRRLA